MNAQQLSKQECQQANMKFAVVLTRRDPQGIIHQVVGMGNDYAETKAYAIAYSEHKNALFGGLDTSVKQRKAARKLVRIFHA